jgi:dihydropyrimidinase
MAQVTGCPVYFPHVTAAKAVEIIARAQAEGQVVYAETCPQYLTLTEDEVLRRRALAKVGPPLRTTEDIAALWAGLVHGVINVIASDHAPKAKRRDDEFFVAPYGSPQAETMLAVVYDAGINGGYITLPQLVQVLCENPAKIFGLYPKKGTLQVGSDADLVIFDPNRVHTISQSTQHSHASYTLYEGRECLGMPILVMQRGHILVEDGQLLGRSGQGQFLRTRIEGRFPLTSEHDDGK